MTQVIVCTIEDDIHVRLKVRAGHIESKNRQVKYHFEYIEIQ